MRTIGSLLIATGADSRVPPGVVFDQVSGDVFTVRVAGDVRDGSLKIVGARYDLDTAKVEVLP